LDNHKYFVISRRVRLNQKPHQLYCNFKTYYSEAGQYCVIHVTFLDSFAVNMMDSFGRKFSEIYSGLHRPKGCEELDAMRSTNYMMMWRLQHCYA
jgi:hypothetical protein